MKNSKKLINFIEEDTKLNGGKVFLHKTKSVKWGQEYSSGFFDDSTMELHVSINKPIEEWIGTLTHEYCHFCQCLENCHHWQKCYESSNDVFEIFEEVLAGKKYSENKLKRVFAAIRNLELDCERRTVNMLQEFKVPIDIKEYCRGASAYVLFYNYVAKHKKWYKKGNAPYQVKEVTDRMPDNLNGRYDRMPKWMEKLFEEHCIKKS